MRANLLLVGFTLVLGWASLYPLRERLGGVGVALLGLPVGALAWQGSALLASALDRPMTPALAAVGALAVAIALFAAALASGGTTRVLPTPREALEFAVAAGLLLAAAVVFARSGQTRASFDSYNFYEPYGIWLADTGRLTSGLVSERMTLLPAMHAIDRLLGASWTFVLYRTFALVVVALTAWLPLRLVRAGRRLPAAVAVAVLGIVLWQAPPFRVHAVLVHSHMASALYLLVAVYGVLLAASFAEDRAAARAWSLVAGLGAAGLALARPDGLAYAFVAVALVYAFVAVRRLDVPSALRVFVPPVAFAGPVIAAVIAREGLWSAPSKLSGKMALAMVAALVLAALGAVVLERLAPRLRLTERYALWAVVALGALAFLGVLALKPAGAIRAVEMMLANMLRYGMWGPLWLYLLAATVLVAYFVDIRRTPALRPALAAVALFFAIALCVHGATHPGRIGWGDSLNRVLIHVVPLWFAALATGASALAMQLHPAAEASVAEEPAEEAESAA